MLSKYQHSTKLIINNNNNNNKNNNNNNNVGCPFFTVASQHPRFFLSKQSNIKKFSSHIFSIWIENNKQTDNCRPMKCCIVFSGRSNVEKSLSQEETQCLGTKHKYFIFTWKVLIWCFPAWEQEVCEVFTSSRTPRRSCSGHLSWWSSALRCSRALTWRAALSARSTT